MGHARSEGRETVKQQNLKYKGTVPSSEGTKPSRSKIPSTHRCDAIYAHREWPLDGQCTGTATARHPSEGNAVDGGPWLYGCATHVAANPRYPWEPLESKV
jgi:hypothetical protein